MAAAIRSFDEQEAFGEVIVDESCFPFVFQAFPARLELASFERYCKRFDRILVRGEPFISIADASAVTERAPPTVRKQLADWSRAIDADVTRLSKGDARVVKSALIRGAMTAVNWLHKTQVPQEWFTTTGEAITWCLSRLDESDVFVARSVRDHVIARTGRR